jgi:hypothetical protein
MEIPIDDQYIIGGREYFQFRVRDAIGCRIHRDVPKDISRTFRPTLDELARICGVDGYKKMRKMDLVETLTPLIIFRVL